VEAGGVAGADVAVDEGEAVEGTALVADPVVAGSAAALVLGDDAGRLVSSASPQPAIHHEVARSRAIDVLERATTTLETRHPTPAMIVHHPEQRHDFLPARRARSQLVAR